MLVVYLGAALHHLAAPTARARPISLVETSQAKSGVQADATNPWLDAWYPVTFAASIPEDSLVSATVFERPLVLFKDQDSVYALTDQCPHRLAPLSDGRLAKDPATGATKLECSYHGWQFAGCGRCTKLPQLEAGKPILNLYDAHAYPVEVSQGIVYVFLGDEARARSVVVPRVPELDMEGWVYEQDYMRDLPYDYTTLVENIIDPSHVPVSHHGTSQGNRALAQPLTTRLRTIASGATRASATGPPQPPLPLAFSGETEVPLHASSRLSFAQQKAVQAVDFAAPSLLSYKFSVGAGDACALFYPIPVARGRSRILVRRGRNFATDRPMSKAALVAKHLENNVVFDQDMAFLRGQEARLQALQPDGFGGAWRQSTAVAASAEASSPLGALGAGYVMPADADRFVISFRKQLDRVAASLPWRSPASAHTAHAPPLPRRELLNRYEQHSKHCAACLAALALTERCAALSRRATQVSLMVALAAVASRAAPSARLVTLFAVGASSYSVVLLRAYVVGPVIGALPNWIAAAPLAASLTAAAIYACRPMDALAHACAILMPLATAAASARAALALEGLRARFIYTEEAKALQASS